MDYKQQVISHSSGGRPGRPHVSVLRHTKLWELISLLLNSLVPAVFTNGGSEEDYEAGQRSFYKGIIPTQEGPALSLTQALFSSYLPKG